MKKDDRQFGRPGILYQNTKANILALTGLVGGETAYATDTGEEGTYDAVGAAWIWRYKNASAQYKYLVAGTTPFAYAESVGYLNIIAGETLTVELDSIVNQDLTTDASPTFDALNIGGTAGAGYIDLIGQSVEPASPAAGMVRIHGETADARTFPEFTNESGTMVVIGRDSVVIAKNVSGGAITKGQAVYVFGSSGNTPTVKLAKADATATILGTIGIVAETTIANNGFGHIVITGVIKSINTSAYTAGDGLYVSAATAGALTNVPPAHPNFQKKVGTILNVGVGNGSMLINTAPFTGGMEVGTNAPSFTAASINKVAITAPATGATLTIADGKTLAVELDSIVNQDLTTDASPIFVTAKLTGLTDGYVPYHVSDAAGLANSPIYTDGTNVGIGTTGPGTRLQVNAADATSPAITVVGDQSAELHKNSAGSSLFLTGLRSDISSGNYVFYSYGGNWIFNNGNVGIGTTSPGYKLDVAAAANGLALQLKADGTADTVFNMLGNTSGTQQLFSIRTNAAAQVAINTQNSARLALGVSTGSSAGSVVEQMTILSSGNVGIGTPSPVISDGTGLHLAGKIVRIATAKTPASAGATGNTGEICWDANYIHVCVATNSWKRTAIAAW